MTVTLEWLRCTRFVGFFTFYAVIGDVAVRRDCTAWHESLVMTLWVKVVVDDVADVGINGNACNLAGVEYRGREGKLGFWCCLSPLYSRRTGFPFFMGTSGLCVMLVMLSRYGFADYDWSYLDGISGAPELHLEAMLIISSTRREILFAFFKRISKLPEVMISLYFSEDYNIVTSI